MATNPIRMACGICGFAGFSDRALVKAMCSELRHRGPDQSDYYVDEGVSLGVDRLKVIDLIKGDQPIQNEDGSVWVVYNGEVYNYQSVRTELEGLGHRFTTDSDTETLVHAYEAWGEGFVARLRGMFAFAIWDSKTKSLYLARDRFGKKPLYYAQIGDRLVFASEMKAVLKYPGIGMAVDHAAMDLFFTYSYIPSPHTIFSSVRKLPPGHYATFQKGRLNIKRYWDAEIKPVPQPDEGAVVERLYRLLVESVKLRLRSDVPLGAFLSGGIDSSVVAAVIARLSESPVKTVSVGFDSGTSEVRYSRQVAEQLKTDHTEVTVSTSAFDILPKLVRHFDEPFADHSMIPTYYISEATRKHVTVALSGDGGDELFMGYPFLLDPPYYSFYSKIPSKVRRPLLRAMMGMPGSSSLKTMATHAYQKGYDSKSPLERYFMRMSAVGPGELESLYSDDILKSHSPTEPSGYLRSLASGMNIGDDLDRLDYLTMKSYLSEGILTKVDRMSMAVSLEVRSPLLDQVLAEYVFTLPSPLKMRGRETKYIFKKMAVSKELVPPEIAHRKKRGFGVPLVNWMTGEWRELANDVLDPIISGKEKGFFDATTVKRTLERPDLYSTRLFALVVFSLWQKEYLQGPIAVKTQNSTRLGPG